LQAVEKEIRRLKQYKQESHYQRYHYRRVRLARGKEGPITEREARLRDGNPLSALAVPETMLAASLRWVSEPVQRGCVSADDIRVLYQTGGPPLEVCLLVDTSGSMNGKRIREVKALADHLVRQMHEPLSLVTFQEGDVGIKVASTRNTERVRCGLTAMNATGLTPLGDGIRTAVNYLSKRHGKKHLLILITDGLPTWAEGEKDPYQDALDAGVQVKKAKIHMICIGLEPQKKFLTNLAGCSGASLYIVNDLEHQEIAAITRREKTLFRQRV
jgi:magnesium chelatase subunit D